MLLHILFAGCLVAMVFLARYSFYRYSLISQEDHEVEWATVVSCLLAALIGLRYAFRNRRVFDGLVALFCLFNGGEEFSWGQRLLGFSPPKFFLESNVQQEVSFHNFFGTSVHDLFFGLIVIGYCLLLPLLTRIERSRKLMGKVGATAPPLAFAPWSILLISVYIAYPIHLSSEWVEMIVAALFLAGAALLGGQNLTSRKILLGVSLVLVTTVILTKISNAQERQGTPERVACAKAEARSLLYDMLHGGAASEKLVEFKVPSHRRVFSAENRGYLDSNRFREFNTTKCAGSATENAELRHRYAVDPWGLSYWIFVVPLPDGSLKLTVYSFGPDRRRDSDEGAPGSSSKKDDDDIGVSGVLPNRNALERNDDSSTPVFSAEPH